jgi:hypothetical protein
VLFVACWNQSSVILEQVCSGFNLAVDKICQEERELNIADYNTYNGKRRFTDLFPDGDHSQSSKLPVSHHKSPTEQRIEDELKKYFNISDEK